MKATNLRSRILSRFPYIGQQMSRSALYRSFYKANRHTLDDALEGLIGEGILKIESKRSDPTDARTRRLIYTRIA